MKGAGIRLTISEALNLSSSTECKWLNHWTTRKEGISRSIDAMYFVVNVECKQDEDDSIKGVMYWEY